MVEGKADTYRNRDSNTVTGTCEKGMMVADVMRVVAKHVQCANTHEKWWGLVLEL